MADEGVIVKGTGIDIFHTLDDGPCFSLTIDRNNLLGRATLGEGGHGGGGVGGGAGRGGPALPHVRRLRPPRQRRPPRPRHRQAHRQQPQSCVCELASREWDGSD